MLPENEVYVEQFHLWLKRKYPTSSTPLHYRSDARLFFEWLGQPALSVRVSDVDRYIQRCHERGQHPASINRRLATLRTFYGWLEVELERTIVQPVIPRRHFVRVGARLPRDIREADLAIFFAQTLSARNEPARSTSGSITERGATNKSRFCIQNQPNIDKIKVYD